LEDRVVERPFLMGAGTLDTAKSPADAKHQDGVVAAAGAQRKLGAAQVDIRK
jgi:hypothetical protein